MNYIEEILAESVYDSDQFSANQIKALNELVDHGLSPEVVGTIAYPGITDSTYRVLFNYINEGYTIDKKEFLGYISKDLNNEDRLNEIIVNVYLGKKKGLTKELIDLYVQPNVKNIKLSRLLVEKCKDYSLDFLQKLININICNTRGKSLIDEFLRDEFDIKKLIIVLQYDTITDEVYEVLHNYNISDLVFLSSEHAIKYNGENCSYILKHKDKFTYLEYIHINSKDIPLFEEIADQNICADLKSIRFLMNILNTHEDAVKLLAVKNKNILLDKSICEWLVREHEITYYVKSLNKYDIVQTRGIDAYLDGYINMKTPIYKQFSLFDYYIQCEMYDNFRTLMPATITLEEINTIITESTRYFKCVTSNDMIDIYFKDHRFMWIFSDNNSYKLIYSKSTEPGEIKGNVFSFATKNELIDAIEDIIIDLEKDQFDHTYLDELYHINDALKNNK